MYGNTTAITSADDPNIQPASSSSILNMNAVFCYRAHARNEQLRKMLEEQSSFNRSNARDHEVDALVCICIESISDIKL